MIPYNIGTKMWINFISKNFKRTSISATRQGEQPCVETDEPESASRHTSDGRGPAMVNAPSHLYVNVRQPQRTLINFTTSFSVNLACVRFPTVQIPNKNVIAATTIALIGRSRSRVGSPSSGRRRFRFDQSDACKRVW